VTERDPERGEGRDPIDEEAAWAEIIAGYGDEPADPPGVWPKGDELDLTDTVDRDAAGAREGDDDGREAHAEHGQDDEHEEHEGHGAGQRPEGPRDWEAAEDEDEGHFVPPEPPPLPQADLTTKLAWVAVLGGPLLLVGAALLQQEMTWWLATLGIGGFLGGFGTLVARMRDDSDDEWPNPGGGAVV
jgi:hypothetical protein